MEINNLELAEFVGILLGDGCITTYRMKYKTRIIMQNRVKITLDSEVDKDYVFFVKDIMAKILKVEPLIRKRKGENTIDVLSFKKSSVDFLIEEVGLKKSPKKFKAIIPEKFRNGMYGLKVLRGYFDTDGALVITNNNGTIYPRLEMKVCPSPMKEQFIEILKKHAFRFGVYKIINEEVRIQINGFAQLKKWHEIIGFSNPKHKIKYDRVSKIYEK